MNTHQAAGAQAQLWRRFCRKGRRLAWFSALLWVGGLAVMFRVVPAPAPVPRGTAPLLTWAGASSPALEDFRALWSPAIFSLPTPMGFTRTLHRQRVVSRPPIQAVQAAPVFLEREKHTQRALFPFFATSVLPRSRPPALLLSTPSEPVFPARTVGGDAPRLFFPEGWESRLFSGIEFNFDEWSDVPWTARVEIRFDEHGVAGSVLVTESSGQPTIDRRLARSVKGWRLLEEQAPRLGRVLWHVPPAPGGEDAAAGGRPE